MMSLPPTLSSKQDEDDDDEFAPENVTFAPKDVTPLDFNPKVGVQGLGYRGLDPGLALQGRGAREHINLFDPQSNTRSQLFGGPEGDGRRRGVAGQVAFLGPAFSMGEVGVGGLPATDDLSPFTCRRLVSELWRMRMKTSTTETPCPSTTRCWEGRSRETACSAGPLRRCTPGRKVPRFS